MKQVRFTLIALEVAASLALAVGGGLMIRTVMNLIATDFGFDTKSVVRARVALPARGFSDPAAIAAAYDDLAARLASQIHGSVALSNFPPFFEPPKQIVGTEGEAGNRRATSVAAVSGGFFQVFGIPIGEGRTFTADDRSTTEPIAVVSRTMARRVNPAGSAVGRRIGIVVTDRRGVEQISWRTVVGVAADIRQKYADDDLADVYVPFAQTPSRFASVYARSASANDWANTLRDAVAGINSAIVVGNANALEAEAAKQLAAPRFLMVLLAGFAAFAALLAMFGIYTVITYSVQQREREMAIRLALGATHRGVTTLFLGNGALVLGSGIVAGLLGSVAITRVLRSQLQGVGSFDAATLAIAVAVIAVGGLLAIWWPAQRATRVNLVTALGDDG